MTYLIGLTPLNPEQATGSPYQLAADIERDPERTSSNQTSTLI
jgi:hypothetical protein